MKQRMHAVAFAAAALALGHGAWAGEAEAKKWVSMATVSLLCALSARLLASFSVLN